MSRLWWLAVAVAAFCASGCKGCGGHVAPTPHTSLQVQPASLDFATLYVGATKALPLHVVNPGRTDVTVDLSAVPPFAASSPLVVSAGANTDLTVTFAPTAAGTFTATLKVDATEVALSGTALAALDCGTPDVCHQRSFDPSTGVCSDTVAGDGTDCTASFACFATAHCQQGQCVGVATTCDDSDRCTLDVCGELGCGHLDSTASCPWPTDPCQIPSCDPATGCGTAQAPDGTSCGTRDCTTAHVCISGTCQLLPAPQTLGCVDVVAGVPGGDGWVDGVGTEGRLGFSVSAIARDATGSLYIADTVNALLRKVTPAGVLTTVAGTLKRQGLADGFGSAAKFDGLRDVAVDLDGTILVADQHAIRRVTPQGLVTTFVGGADAGSQDGIGAAAGFNGLVAISVGPDGTVWAIDGDTPMQLRRISRQGEVVSVGDPFMGYGGHADVLGLDGGALIARGDVFEIAADGGVTPVLPSDGFWQVLSRTLDGGIAMLSWNATHQPLSLLGDDGGVTEVLPFDFFAGEFVQFDATRWALVVGNRIELTDGALLTVLTGAASPRVTADGPVATVGLGGPLGVGVRSDGGVVFCDDLGIRTVAGGGVWTLFSGGGCDDLAVLPDDTVLTTPNLDIDHLTPLFAGCNAQSLSTAGFEVSFLGSCTSDLGLFNGSTLDGGFNLVAQSALTGMGPIDFNAVDVVRDGDGGYWLAATPMLEHVDDAGVTFETVSLGTTVAGLQRDSAGNLWTLDQQSYLLLKVSPAGVVTPVAQLADQPKQLALEPGGTVLVTVPDAILRVHP